MVNRFFIGIFVKILILNIKIMLFFLKKHKQWLEILVKKKHRYKYFNEYVGYTITISYFNDFYEYLKKYKNYF